MANDYKYARGIVAAVAQNTPERYGVRLGEQWLDGSGQCPVHKGQAVRVLFVEDDQSRMIRGIWVADERAEEHGNATQRNPHDDRIARAVALKCAVALSSGWGVSVDELVEVAERLQSWLSARRDE